MAPVERPPPHAPADAAEVSSDRAGGSQSYDSRFERLESGISAMLQILQPMQAKIELLKDEMITKEQFNTAMQQASVAQKPIL